MAIGRMLNRKVSLSVAMHALPDDTARLLATWTIPHLDKHGVFYADPAVVRSLVLPMRLDITVEAVSRILDAMEAAGLIVRFEALGRRWMFWPGFAENQPYLRGEKEKTDFPAPAEMGSRTLSGCFPTNSDQIPTVSRQIPTAVGKMSLEEKRKEEEGKENAREARPPAPSRRQFKGFGGVILTADDDPRVAAYLATLRPEITETNADLVRNRIPFDDLAVWQETLTNWAANEWRADNFAGLFERFDAARNGKRVRATMPAKPAMNGRGRPFMAPQVTDPTAAERVASEERARQQRAERAARKAAMQEVTS